MTKGFDTTRKSNRPQTIGQSELDREDPSADRLDFWLRISNILIKLFLARLGYDARIWISIVIFDREGRPNMRLRRRPFQIREPLHSISQEQFLYFLTVVPTRQNFRKYDVTVKRVKLMTAKPRR